MTREIIISLYVSSFVLSWLTLVLVTARINWFFVHVLGFKKPFLNSFYVGLIPLVNTCIAILLIIGILEDFYKLRFKKIKESVFESTVLTFQEFEIKRELVVRPSEITDVQFSDN